MFTAGFKYSGTVPDIRRVAIRRKKNGEVARSLIFSSQLISPTYQSYGRNTAITNVNKLNSDSHSVTSLSEAEQGGSWEPSVNEIHTSTLDLLVKAWSADS